MAKWIILTLMASSLSVSQPQVPAHAVPSSPSSQPIKLKSEDSLKIRELEVAYERARADQANLALQYQQAERAVKELGDELNKLLSKFRQDYKCPDCGLNDKDLTLEKKVSKEVTTK